MVVEVARRGDAQAIYEVHRGVLGEGRYFITRLAEFEATADPAHREFQILEMDQSSNSVFLVARHDDEVAGFLTLRGGSLARMRHVAKLEIMVDQPHRGRGVGRALMDACIDWSTRNGEIQKIGLNVFDDNTRAIALYEGLGFAVEGHREREYRMADGTFRGDVLMFLWV